MHRMLYRTKVNKENTKRLIVALFNYSKIFTEKNNSYKNHPLRDWTLHPVELHQIRTLAIEHLLMNEQDSERICYS